MASSLLLSALSSSMASSLLLSSRSSLYLLSRSSRKPTISSPPILGSSKPIKPPSTLRLSLNPHKGTSLRSFKRVEASIGGDSEAEEVTVGEDSAVFELGEQKLSSWIYFTGILGSVLFGLNALWIDPSTGYGTAFVDAISSISESPEVVMLILIFIFAAVHSGLASVRDAGEKLIGERAFRVLFAGISLPLAISTVVYFVNHRYDGTQLWQAQSIPGVHELVWISSFVSFLFLYPSTFNLLEVAAVDKPKMHLWETGIMRITRHPQDETLSDGRAGGLVLGSHAMDRQLGDRSGLRRLDRPPLIWGLEWRSEIVVAIWGSFRRHKGSDECGAFRCDP